MCCQGSTTCLFQNSLHSFSKICQRMPKGMSGATTQIDGHDVSQLRQYGLVRSMHGVKRHIQDVSALLSKASLSRTNKTYTYMRVKTTNTMGITAQPLVENNIRMQMQRVRTNQALYNASCRQNDCPCHTIAKCVHVSKPGLRDSDWSWVVWQFKPHKCALACLALRTVFEQ